LYRTADESRSVKLTNSAPTTRPTGTYTNTSRSSPERCSSLDLRDVTQAGNVTAT